MGRRHSWMRERNGGYEFEGTVNGKRIRKRLGGNYSEALERGLEILRDEEGPVGELTVREFGERKWLRDRVKRRRNQKGQQLLHTRFHKYIDRDLGNKKLRQVRVEEIMRFAEFLESQDLAPRTIHHVLGHLKSLLKYAYKLDLLVKVPDFEDAMPALVELAPRRLSDEQVDQVLQVLPPLHQLIVRFLLLTALRLGELGGLERRHVVWKPLPHLIIEKTKNRKVRYPALFPEAQQVLLELLEWPRPRKREANVIPISYGGLGNIAKRSWDKCGFQWTMHQCRHTCLSRLKDRGVPMQFVQQFAGHSSIQQTEGYAQSHDMVIWEYFGGVDLTTLRQEPRQIGHSETEQPTTEKVLARIDG